MSVHELPPNWAPYHIVRTDLPRVQCGGKFHDLSIAASTLDFMRAHFPHQEWGILSDGGLLDDSKLPRSNSPLDDTDYVFKSLGGPRKPTFKILRKAA